MVRQVSGVRAEPFARFRLYALNFPSFSLNDYLRGTDNPAREDECRAVE